MKKLEEVARALRDADNPIAKNCQMTPLHYYDLAKAAIEELMKVDEGMVDASVSAGGETIGKRNTAVFRAMLKHVLEE